jgi:hypothetical protein
MLTRPCGQISKRWCSFSLTLFEKVPAATAWSGDLFGYQSEGLRPHDTRPFGRLTVGGVVRFRPTVPGLVTMFFAAGRLGTFWICHAPPVRDARAGRPMILFGRPNSLPKLKLASR